MREACLWIAVALLYWHVFLIDMRFKEHKLYTIAMMRRHGLDQVDIDDALRFLKEKGFR